MSDRVYMPHGTVAHVIKGSPNNAAERALCGRSAWPWDWFGTGTQAEHETAAELPLCVACKAKLAR